MAHPASALCREKHMAFERCPALPHGQPEEIAPAGWKDYALSTVSLCSPVQPPQPRFGTLFHAVPRIRVGASLHVCGRTLSRCPVSWPTLKGSKPPAPGKAMTNSNQENHMSKAQGSLQIASSSPPLLLLLTGNLKAHP